MRLVTKLSYAPNIMYMTLKNENIIYMPNPTISTREALLQSQQVQYMKNLKKHILWTTVDQRRKNEALTPHGLITNIQSVQGNH